MTLPTGPEADDEENRLAALLALDVLDTPAEERFDRVTRLAKRLFGVDGAAVNMIDRDRQWTKSVAGERYPDLPRADSICAVAIQSSGVFEVNDLSTDDRFSDLDYVTGDPRLRFYAGQPLEAGGARVGTLCVYGSTPRALSEGDLALLRDLALWVEKELVLDEEMSRAAEVQRGLLPSVPPTLPGYDVAGVCLTSREVGGDLFDWYPCAGRLALTVADIMGKGLPAAIMMATLRAVLRAGSRTGDVATAVELGADTMASDFADSGAFATLLHALLSPDTGELAYVDAGHGLAVVVAPDGSTRPLDVRGVPAGALEGATWTAGSVALAPGDTLVVYSDGLLDLHRDQAAVDRQVVEAVVTSSTAAEVVDFLTWAARSLKLPDDVTVLAVRRSL